MFLKLLKRLLADADAVIDNYAADVLPRLGLDAAAMLNINPRLVVVTMPAFMRISPRVYPHRKHFTSRTSMRSVEIATVSAPP